MGRKFHPWEGGEGKATTQYTRALVEMAKKAIVKEDWTEAKELLEKALVYPKIWVKVNWKALRIIILITILL